MSQGARLTVDLASRSTETDSNPHNSNRTRGQPRPCRVLHHEKTNDRLTKDLNRLLIDLPRRPQKFFIQSFSSEIIQFWRCFSLPWHANRPAIGGTSSASDLSVQRSFLQATARYGLMLQSNLSVLCFMIFFFFLFGYDLP